MCYAYNFFFFFFFVQLCLVVHHNMTSASKNTIVDQLNKSKKLNGDSYEIWAMKIQYLLEEQEAL